MNTFFRIFTTLLLIANVSFAQVGIGTTDPKGTLDVQSTTSGIVYPSVALTSTATAAPVVNPAGPSLAVGTTIYNTNTTNTGANDVEPGIYSWDGMGWVVHFFKRQQELFIQETSLRTSSNTGFVDIPGFETSPIIDVTPFVAKYSGLYRIELRLNYGGGAMVDNGDINTAMASGDFRFIFDGTTYTLNVKSFSTYNDHIGGGGTDYVNAWVQTTKTIYLNLVQGQSYDVMLEFDQAPGTGFVNSGDSGTGRGYIGEDVPCYIEFTYLND